MSPGAGSTDPIIDALRAKESLGHQLTTIEAMVWVRLIGLGRGQRDLSRRWKRTRPWVSRLLKQIDSSRGGVTVGSPPGEDGVGVSPSTPALGYPGECSFLGPTYPGDGDAPAITPEQLADIDFARRERHQRVEAQIAEEIEKPDEFDTTDDATLDATDRELRELLGI